VYTNNIPAYVLSISSTQDSWSHEELRYNDYKSKLPSNKYPVIETNLIKEIKELKFNYKYNDNLYNDLFVGDLVTRGDSWCYDLDDGGEGSVGIVLAINSEGFGLVIVRWKGNYIFLFY
jgi:hypothetical protein